MMPLLRVAAAVVLVVGLIACAVVRLSGGGWELLRLIVPYAGILLCHAGVNGAAIVLSRRLLTLSVAVLSTLLLFIAFSLQVDYGDGAGSWFGIDALIPRSRPWYERDVLSWWPLPNLVLFLPVMLTWGLAGVLCMRDRNQASPPA